MRASSAMRCSRCGGGLGLLQIGQRSRKIVGHPLHRREPDPGKATFPIIGGRLQGRLIGAPGIRHGAEVVQHFALEAGQRETVGPLGRQRRGRSATSRSAAS